MSEAQVEVGIARIYVKDFFVSLNLHVLLKCFNNKYSLN